MLIPPHLQWLQARQGPPPDSQDSKQNGQSQGNNNAGSDHTRTTIGIICAAVLVFLVTSLVVVFFILRTLRRMNCRPKLLPGKYLKDKWNRWNAGRSYGQVPNRSSPNQEEDTTYRSPSQRRGAGSEMDTANNGVRRETSVRSVISLPPYSASPKPEEQIVAREGERGGMDVVEEFPETAEEEEARREELMESLYQIRVQRRQENAEREARRQARRDARAQGNFIRLEELRLQSIARRDRSNSGASASNPNLSASALLAEHQSRGREKRIASVNYAALGRVRHDGSRLRANSADSDNRPLLEEGSGNPISHYRGESYSSLLSGSSINSDGEVLTPVASQRQSEHSARSRSNSRPISIPEEEDDEETTDAPAPPNYEHLEWGEAPPYSSPIAQRFPSSVRDDGNSNEQREQPQNNSNESSERNENSETNRREGQNDTAPSSEGHHRTERNQPPAPLNLLTPLPSIQVQMPSPISDLTPTTPTQPEAREQAPEHSAGSHDNSDVPASSPASGPPSGSHQDS